MLYRFLLQDLQFAEMDSDEDEEDSDSDNEGNVQEHYESQSHGIDNEKAQETEQSLRLPGQRKKKKSLLIEECEENSVESDK